MVTLVLGYTSLLRTCFPPDMKKDHLAQWLSPMNAAYYTLYFCLFWVTGRAAAYLLKRGKNIYSEC